MYKEVFTVRLKEIRKEIGLNQSEVAANIGVARTNISKYEMGLLEPNIETIGKIAELYNVPIDWLFGRSPKQ